MIRCLFVLLVFPVVIFAQRYETISYGHWNNPAIWQNELIPPHSFSDSVIIKHAIVLSANLENSGFMQIDSSGAICGHRHVLVRGTFHVYGYFEVDSLKVDGGFVRIFGPGNNVATHQTAVTNGGLLTLSGGSLAVGPWFDCRDSEFNFIGTDNLDRLELKIYPNPVADLLTIETDKTKLRYELLNLSGQKILETQNPLISVSHLKNGIYFLKISDELNFSVTRKIVVRH